MSKQTKGHDVLMAINSRIINGRKGTAKQLNADYRALLKARTEITMLRVVNAELEAAVKAERKVCAELCEKLAEDYDGDAAGAGAYNCATAIRARQTTGEKA